MTRAGIRGAGALRVYLALVLVPLALAGSACRPSAGEPPESAPYIRGPVVERSEKGIVVRRGEESLTSEPSAVVYIERHTRILYRDGEDAPAAELVTGREVSVWITGPVRESLPVQVDATHIVIERDMAVPPSVAPPPAAGSLDAPR